MLSMYYDDEEDDEMEDVEDDDRGGQEAQRREPPQDDDYRDPRGVEDALRVDSSDRMVAAGDSGNDENTPQDVVNDENFTPTPSGAQFRPSTPQQAQVSFTSPPLPQQQRTRRGKLAIVDYGHDEVAMSPEPEVLFVFSTFG